jgi:tetratricopeptide (TPR) repeat protein
VDSPLLTLIRELAGGPGMQRWTAARLREALNEELSGNFLEAVSILQVVMAQVEDPRIRAERDRLHSKALQASSGVFRSQAIEAERELRHNEAAENWRKVLEAQPNDADAALHAAMCYMEGGNLKQAGALARRAVELAPASVNAHRILYRFFRKTGMEASAKREHEILSKLRRA